MAFVEQVYSQLELNRVSLDPPPICEPRLPALASFPLRGPQTAIVMKEYEN